MKLRIRYLLIFFGAVIAGVYLHEIGHVVAGLVNGVAVFPTPAKEYVLQAQLDWSKEIWVALGGVSSVYRSNGHSRLRRERMK